MDALPWALRRDDMVGVNRYLADDGLSELVMTYERPSPVRLSGLFAVRKRHASTPLHERLSAFRPAAEAVCEAVEATRGESRGDGRLRARSYTKIDDF